MKHLHPSWWLINLVVLVGSSCTTTPLSNGEVKYSDWTEVIPGVELKQQVVALDTVEELFTIVRVDLTQRSLHVASNSAVPKTVADWQAELATPLVINGSYFSEDYQLLTRTITDQGSSGTVLSGPTGWAYASTKQPWTIERDLSVASETITAGIQSYPVLVWDGQVYFTAGSKAVAQRTVLAQDYSGQWYVIVTEYGVLTLAQLADSLVQQLDLDLHVALNLDGGTSTGLSIVSPAVQYQVGSAVVPSVLYFE